MTESPLAVADPTSWQGCLELEFVQRSDKTILSRSVVQAPLKVQRPFYPEGDAVCHSVMLHTAGGIVGGDRLSLSIQLQPQAQALITSAAATKVYRSKGREAQQFTQIRVASDACLEWLPQETIVFDGALYRQRLKVDLAAGATWMGWEITRLGRTARGERFTAGEWRSHTEIWQDNQLVWVDPQWIQGGSTMLDSPHGLAGCPVIGSLAFVGQIVSRDVVEQARSLKQVDEQINGQVDKQIDKPFQPFASSPCSSYGVTRLPIGLLCRYRGHSSATARQWFTQIWHLIRQEYRGRMACVPRVWR